MSVNSATARTACGAILVLVLAIQSATAAKQHARKHHDTRTTSQCRLSDLAPLAIIAEPTLVPPPPSPRRRLRACMCSHEGGPSLQILLKMMLCRNSLRPLTQHKDYWTPHSTGNSPSAVAVSCPYDELVASVIDNLRSKPRLAARGNQEWIVMDKMNCRASRIGSLR
jgi:hypothetical protein